MKINLLYAVPGSADCEYEIELSAEEEAAYFEATSSSTKLAEVPALQAVLERAAQAIPAYDAAEYGTAEAVEFCAEAMSAHVMDLVAEKCSKALAAFNLDADDINASIAARDAKALAMFGLADYASEYDNDVATQDNNEAKVAAFLEDFDFDSWAAEAKVNFCEIVSTIGYIDIKDFMKEVDPDYEVDYTACPLYAGLAVRFADDE